MCKRAGNIQYLRRERVAQHHIVCGRIARRCVRDNECKRHDIACVAGERRGGFADSQTRLDQRDKRSRTGGDGVGVITGNCVVGARLPAHILRCVEYDCRVRQRNGFGDGVVGILINQVAQRKLRVASVVGNNRIARESGLARVRKAARKSGRHIGRPRNFQTVHKRKSRIQRIGHDNLRCGAFRYADGKRVGDDFADSHIQIRRILQICAGNGFACSGCAQSNRRIGGFVFLREIIAAFKIAIVEQRRRVGDGVIGAHAVLRQQVKRDDGNIGPVNTLRTVREITRGE